MAAHIAGHLAVWPTKDHMAAILRNGGLRIQVGLYSVRVADCSHFVFQEYGGDLGDPSIDADADTVADMIREGRLVFPRTQAPLGHAIVEARLLSENHSERSILKRSFQIRVPKRSMGTRNKRTLFLVPMLRF